MDLKSTLAHFSALKLKDKISNGHFGPMYQAHHELWGNVSYEKLDTMYLGEATKAKMKKDADKRVLYTHSNILKAISTVLETGNYGIVYDPIVYGTLEDFNSTSCIDSWHWKLKVLHGIALGINYLHTSTPPVLHLNLTLEAVYMCEGFTPKISHFQLDMWKGYALARAERTLVCKKSRHTPPEIFKDLCTPPHWSFDTYSFGILLWELINNEQAFNSIDPMDLRQVVMAGDRPTWNTADSIALKRCSHITQQCWWPNPNDRASFSEIKQVMEFTLKQFHSDITKSITELRKSVMTKSVMT